LKFLWLASSRTVVQASREERWLAALREPNWALAAIAEDALSRL
jgi:hypothetical protein